MPLYFCVRVDAHPKEKINKHNNIENSKLELRSGNKKCEANIDDPGKSEKVPQTVAFSTDNPGVNEGHAGPLSFIDS